MGLFDHISNCGNLKYMCQLRQLIGEDAAVPGIHPAGLCSDLNSINNAGHLAAGSVLLAEPPHTYAQEAQNDQNNRGFPQ
jgi:hypothetical protein